MLEANAPGQWMPQSVRSFKLPIIQPLNDIDGDYFSIIEWVDTNLKLNDIQWHNNPLTQSMTTTTELPVDWLKSSDPGTRKRRARKKRERLNRRRAK